MPTKMLKDLFQTTWKECKATNISHLSAALSYYTIFSLVPILVLCIMFGGVFFGHDYVSRTIFSEMSEALGKSTSLQLRTLIENFQRPTDNLLVTLLGIFMLLWGTAGFLTELQNSFNTIWSVQPKPGRSWVTILQDRFFSFVIVIGSAFLLLTSLIFSAFISRMSQHFHYIMPTATVLWVLVDFSISTVAITVLFAAIFKILPDVVLKWSDVFLGAFATALLFALGKFVLTVYITKSNIASYYGFTASVITILVWVYYSSQILLFGAVFTKAYTKEFGSQYRAKKIAKHVDKKPPQHI